GDKTPVHYSILAVRGLHVSGVDVIGIQHAEVGDPACHQMLWPLRLNGDPRWPLCVASAHTSRSRTTPTEPACWSPPGSPLSALGTPGPPTAPPASAPRWTCPVRRGRW